MTSKLDEQIAEKREKLETLYNETSFGGEGFSHGYIKGEIVALEYASTIIRALEAKLEKAKTALHACDAAWVYESGKINSMARSVLDETLKELDNEE